MKKTKNSSDDTEFTRNTNVNNGQDAINPINSVPEMQVPQKPLTQTQVDAGDASPIVAQPEPEHREQEDIHPARAGALLTNHGYVIFAVELALANGTDPIEALSRAKAAVGIS